MNLRRSYFKIRCTLSGELGSASLIAKLCLDHLAVEAGDVGDGLVLRADSLASASVGAIAGSCYHTEYIALN